MGGWSREAVNSVFITNNRRVWMSVMLYIYVIVRNEEVKKLRNCVMTHLRRSQCNNHHAMTMRTTTKLAVCSPLYSARTMCDTSHHCILPNMCALNNEKHPPHRRHCFGAFSYHYHYETTLHLKEVAPPSPHS